jgi:hypothetical protein
MRLIEAHEISFWLLTMKNIVGSKFRPRAHSVNINLCKHLTDSQYM